MSDSIKKYKEIWEPIEEKVEPTSTHDFKEPNPRKNYPMYRGLLSVFPKSLSYVSYVSNKGNDQHHPNTPIHWDRNKSNDHLDALVRHLTDHSVNPIDDDELLHLGKVAWRALAMLEIYLEENEIR